MTAGLRSDAAGYSALQHGGVDVIKFNANGLLNAPVAVRQAVLSGPVDSNGFAAFGGSTGSTTVTAAGTLKATAAASGDANYTGSIVNPSWTGLSVNGTMFLYLDIDQYGTITTGSTTLAPAYQWGGAYSTTNNQNTFNIQEMTMKVGNGSTASQVYRVFVGEVTVAGGVTTAIVWYALMGRYDSGFTATLPGTSTTTSKNSFIGVKPWSVAVVIECTTTDSGYSVGDQLLAGYMTGAGGAFQSLAVWATSNTVGFTTSTPNAAVVFPKGGGSGVNLTPASWKYKLVAQRGW